MNNNDIGVDVRAEGSGASTIHSLDKKYPAAAAAAAANRAGIGTSTRALRTASES